MVGNKRHKFISVIIESELQQGLVIKLRRRGCGRDGADLYEDV